MFFILGILEHLLRLLRESTQEIVKLVISPLLCFDFDHWTEVDPFVLNYFYRTRVRSLAMLVSDSLTDSLTPV